MKIQAQTIRAATPHLMPESFVVDGKGVIRYQHIGPIEAKDMPLILAKLGQAK